MSEENCKDIEDLVEIFQNCDDACENDNRHEMIGLCEKIFDSIEKDIHPDCHIKVARAIAEQILKSF